VIKKKKLKVKLLSAATQPVQLGKKKKKKLKLREHPMKTTSNSSSDFDSEFDAPKPKVVRPPVDAEFEEEFSSAEKSKVHQSPRIKWSEIEDRYVAFCIKNLWTEEANVPHEVLGDVATRLNNKFHNGEHVRNNSSLWWHIHALQKKGADVFSQFSTRAGPPDPKKALPGAPPILGHNAKPAGGVRTKEAQVVSGALREPVIPSRPQAPARQTVQVPQKKSGGVLFDIIAKGPDGRIERFTTSKFSSLEEIMIALA
jgi:hypothetical protein